MKQFVFEVVEQYLNEPLLQIYIAFSFMCFLVLIPSTRPFFISMLLVVDLCPKIIFGVILAEQIAAILFPVFGMVIAVTVFILGIEIGMRMPPWPKK